MTLPERILGSTLLQPLATRDYRLLAFASIVSLLGDGFFYVALAWQVYEISNVPTALSLVGVAWTIPMVALLLVGGAFSDRFDRRRLMMGADILRGAAIGAMALLSLAGTIELWHIAALGVLVGMGDAFFNPASTAIVPDLLPEHHLPSANALAGIYRPLVFRLLGPALAGFIIAALGPGVAFGVDGLTFVVSAIALAAIRTRPVPREVAAGAGPMLLDVRERLRY